jgi:tyrosyl-tRNA synthetase
MDAAAEFERRFGAKRGTLDLKGVKCRDIIVKGRKIWIVDLLRNAGLVESGGEARRKIKAGAVRLDGEKVTDSDFEMPVSATREVLVKLGRQFVRVRIKIGPARKQPRR